MRRFAITLLAVGSGATESIADLFAKHGVAGFVG